MRKNLLILLLLVAGAVSFILIMVGTSDPEKLIIEAHREFPSVAMQPVDTIRFPAWVSVMTVGDNCLYAYANKTKTLYRYDLLERKSDSLLDSRGLFKGVLSAADHDDASNTFYFLNANANKIYSYQPEGSLRDSLDGGAIRMASGEKCVSGGDFIVRTIDYRTNNTGIHKIDYVAHRDSTLYIFPHYQDGGISADGFFRKEPIRRRDFYIPYYNSEIIVYDEMNNKLSKIISIDRTPPANATVPTELGYTISSKSRMINIAAAADSAHLYILSYTSTREGKEAIGTVIDVYDIDNGRYAYSLRFPYFEKRPVSLIERRGNLLFIGFRDIVLEYRLKNAI